MTRGALLELFRASLEDCGLVSATIHHRLSTVCGLFRDAHIDGLIPTKPGPQCADAPCTRGRSRAWTEMSSCGSCTGSKPALILLVPRSHVAKSKIVG